VAVLSTDIKLLRFAYCHNKGFRSGL
jgi:hypothetical protein